MVVRPASVYVRIRFGFARIAIELLLVRFKDAATRGCQSDRAEFTITQADSAMTAVTTLEIVVSANLPFPAPIARSRKECVCTGSPVRKQWCTNSDTGSLPCADQVMYKRGFEMWESMSDIHGHCKGKCKTVSSMRAAEIQWRVNAYSYSSSHHVRAPVGVLVHGWRFRRSASGLR